jgi:4-amino-4-deoxy-L-arabinose transferase-like glycosyltransferase
MAEANKDVPHAAPPAPSKALHVTAACALLFVLAFLPRMYLAHKYRSEAVWDGHYYEFYARRIADGFGYSDPRVVSGVDIGHPSCHYPVGYSAAIGALYKLFGPKLSVACIFNATVGALLAVCTERVASFGLSRTRALVAGVLVALHPGLIYYAATIMSEPLAALGTLLAFWTCLHFRAHDKRLVGAVLGALVLGASALVRPQALLCAPLLAPIDWHQLLRKRTWLSVGTVAKTAALLVLPLILSIVPVLPWTARNCARMDGCAFVSTNGGWNLAIGAFPRATGRFEALHGTDGCRDVTGQVNQDRCWFQYGLAQIKLTPGRWLALIPKKLGYTFDHESFAVEYLHEARPELWPEPMRADTRNRITLAHRVLLLAACFAGIARRRMYAADKWRLPISALQATLAAIAVGIAALGLSASTPYAWPLAVLACTLPALPIPGAPPRAAGLMMSLGLVASVLLTHAIFFGEDRYHLVATPVLCLLAAASFRLQAPEKSSVRATAQAAHAKHNGPHDCAA